MTTQSSKGFTLASSAVLAIAMFSAAALGGYLRPTHRLADFKPKIDLSTQIPKSFGDWKEDLSMVPVLPNPEVQASLDVLYSATLARTYINSKGQRVMLSIAYGNEQRGDLELHQPNLCYPAQGFTVTEQRRGAISTGGGNIYVKRLEAQKGTRVEPITYWVRIGQQNTTSMSLFGRRLEDLRFALKGQVPDGLLFRVSSIDVQRERAFRLHDQFVTDLLGAVAPSGQQHLIGSL